VSGAARVTAGNLAAAVLLAFATTASLVLAVPRDATAASNPAQVNPAQLLWLVKSNDLAALDQQAAADGETLPAFTWVGCGGQSDVFHCLAGQVPIFTSYWGLAARAEAGWRGTAVFDIEPWDFTPSAQRQDPDKWICLAAQLQQTDPHLKVIITPFGRPANSVMIGEDAEAAKCGAYAVDVQTQFANNSPARFSAFIRAAVRAIRSANKKATILAGLATNSPSVVTPAEMTTDYYAALAAGVQGFWLNANNWFGGSQCTAAEGGQSCPQTAIQFLVNIGMITSGSVGSTPSPSPTPSVTPSKPARSSSSKPARDRRRAQQQASQQQALERAYVRFVLDGQLTRLADSLALIAASGPAAWIAADLVFPSAHQT
jgi:hypothetical protein